MKVLAACALAVGCQANDAPAKPAMTAAECGLFLTKARPVLEELATKSGMTYTKSIEDNALRDCQADVAAGKPMRFARCVLDSIDDKALHACFPDYDVIKP